MHDLKKPLLFLAVALTTFTGMVLEIALTRVLSILFFYNYVFVILSVAVLGMGLGAAVVHRQRKLWANGQLGWLALAAANGPPTGTWPRIPWTRRRRWPGCRIATASRAP